MLKVYNTPRLSWPQVMGTDADQKQLRQYSNAKGFLNGPCILPHLMLAHPQVRFQFAVDRFNGPAFFDMQTFAELLFWLRRRSNGMDKSPCLH